MKELRENEAKHNFHQLERDANEQFFLYSTGLEHKFRMAFPKMNVETSKVLREKFLATISKSFNKFLSGQIMMNKLQTKETSWSDIQRISRFKDIKDQKNSLVSHDNTRVTEEIVVNMQNIDVRPDKKKNSRTYSNPDRPNFDKDQQDERDNQMSRDRVYQKNN